MGRRNVRKTAALSFDDEEDDDAPPFVTPPVAATGAGATSVFRRGLTTAAGARARAPSRPLWDTGAGSAAPSAAPTGAAWGSGDVDYSETTLRELAAAQRRAPAVRSPGRTSGTRLGGSRRGETSRSGVGDADRRGLGSDEEGVWGGGDLVSGDADASAGEPGAGDARGPKVGEEALGGRGGVSTMDEDNGEDDDSDGPVVVGYTQDAVVGGNDAMVGDAKGRRDAKGRFEREPEMRDDGGGADSSPSRRPPFPPSSSRSRSHRRRGRRGLALACGPGGSSDEEESEAQDAWETAKLAAALGGGAAVRGPGDGDGDDDGDGPQSPGSASFDGSSAHASVAAFASPSGDRSSRARPRAPVERALEAARARETGSGASSEPGQLGASASSKAASASADLFAAAVAFGASQARLLFPEESTKTSAGDADGSIGDGAARPAARGTLKLSLPELPKTLSAGAASRASSSARRRPLQHASTYLPALHALESRSRAAEDRARRALGRMETRRSIEARLAERARRGAEAARARGEGSSAEARALAGRMTWLRHLQEWLADLCAMLDDRAPVAEELLERMVAQGWKKGVEAGGQTGDAEASVKGAPAGRRELLALSSTVFSDAQPSLCSSAHLAAHLSAWDAADPEGFARSHAAEFAPALFAAFFRVDLLLWEAFWTLSNDETQPQVAEEETPRRMEEGDGDGSSHQSPVSPSSSSAPPSPPQPVVPLPLSRLPTALLLLEASEPGGRADPASDETLHAFVAAARQAERGSEALRRKGEEREEEMTRDGLRVAGSESAGASPLPSSPSALRRSSGGWGSEARSEALACLVSQIAAPALAETLRRAWDPLDPRASAALAAAAGDVLAHTGDEEGEPLEMRRAIADRLAQAALHPDLRPGPLLEPEQERKAEKETTAAMTNASTMNAPTTTNTPPTTTATPYDNALALLRSCGALEAVAAPEGAARRVALGDLARLALVPHVRSAVAQSPRKGLEAVEKLLDALPEPWLDGRSPEERALRDVLVGALRACLAAARRRRNDPTQDADEATHVLQEGQDILDMLLDIDA